MGYKQDLKEVVSRIKAARHHFELLGVHKHSDATDISAARKELAQVVHPDKLIANGVPQDRRDYMALVNNAADVLLDDKRRKLYMAELASGRGKCPACTGEGRVRKQRGFKKIEYHACDTCGGAGLV